RNLSSLRPGGQHPAANQGQEVEKIEQGEPDAEILKHERSRELELKVFELRDKLEDEV
ncbi:hypothetical protein K470DRAFT_260514, partial [Piedraia hortae CBS 480.64]